MNKLRGIGGVCEGWQEDGGRHIFVQDDGEEENEKNSWRAKLVK